MDILQKILARKVEEIQEAAQKLPLRQLSAQVASAPPVRDFVAALKSRVEKQQNAVIAEIKKASPSKGLLRADFDPLWLAARYEAAGAAALSILTDRDFFQGAPEYLQNVRQHSGLPILRKDFLLDAYQVYEARVWGADAILLIVAALGDAQLRELSLLAADLGMATLFEVHNLEELQRIIPLEPELVGINNRNLRTFHTDLATTLDLLTALPPAALVISESGISSQQDMEKLNEKGVFAFLIGEQLMRADDPGQALKDLLTFEK
jgi:indole-3-glycerol phosphate synthase